MEWLSAFNSFFELLGAIYFGGLAMLSFIENSATDHIYDKIKENEKNHTKIHEFFVMKVNLEKTPGTLAITKYFFFYIFYLFVNWFLHVFF